MSIAVAKATDLCARTCKKIRPKIFIMAWRLKLKSAKPFRFGFLPARFRFGLVNGGKVPGVFLFADLF